MDRYGLLLGQLTGARGAGTDVCATPVTGHSSGEYSTAQAQALATQARFCARENALGQSPLIRP